MPKPLYLLLPVLLPLLGFAAPTQITNGRTALIEPQASVSQATFEGKPLPLLRHPADPDRRFILVPVSYRSETGEKRLTLTGPEGDESVAIQVVPGDYASETLKVEPSKVTPPAAARERIDREYREAMDVYARRSPERYWNAPFALPMTSPVTSAFGTARRFNDTLQSFHSGTDFKAAVGSQITAVNAGVVVIAQDRYYAGNSVVVDHGEGLYSCYYHLSRIDVAVGDRVEKGSLLGLSGRSGRVTGPHLHFAVMLYGVQVDPMQLITTLNALFPAAPHTASAAHP